MHLQEQKHSNEKTFHGRTKRKTQPLRKQMSGTELGTCPSSSSLLLFTTLSAVWKKMWSVAERPSLPLKLTKHLLQYSQNCACTLWTTGQGQVLFPSVILCYRIWKWSCRETMRRLWERQTVPRVPFLFYLWFTDLFVRVSHLCFHSSSRRCVYYVFAWVCADKGLEWRGTVWIPQRGWLCSGGDAAFGSGQRLFIGGPEESPDGPVHWCAHLCQRVPCFHWSGQVCMCKLPRNNSNLQ